MINSHQKIITFFCYFYLSFHPIRQYKPLCFLLAGAGTDDEEEGFLRTHKKATITKNTRTSAPPTAKRIARIGVTLKRPELPPPIPPPSRVSALSPDSAK